MDEREQVLDDAKKVLENESRKYRSDRILIESLREVQAIQQLTRALEEMIDARNRHAGALEREARALRELEDAREFAGVDSQSKRKPPSRVLRIEKRKRV